MRLYHEYFNLYAFLLRRKRMALKTVNSFVTCDDLDELIVIGYIRMFEVDISLTIPTAIIDVIYKCYKRNSLDVIVMKRNGKNTQNCTFSWKTNKHHLHTTIVDIEADIKPFCIHNIRKFTALLLDLDILPNTYINVVQFDSNGSSLSINEHQVINKFYRIYFYELRHNDYVNKQFGLINNPCKVMILRFVQKKKKNGNYMIKLPVNVKISVNIVLKMAKSLFNEFQKMLDSTYDPNEQEFSIKHIKLVNTIKGNKLKIKPQIKCDKYITTDFDISNDLKVFISIVVSTIK